MGLTIIILDNAKGDDQVIRMDASLPPNDTHIDKNAKRLFDTLFNSLDKNIWRRFSTIVNIWS